MIIHSWMSAALLYSGQTTFNVGQLVEKILVNDKVN